jgi:hypothetical protein
MRTILDNSTGRLTFTPNSHEIEVLKMLDGEREGEWGAWVGACLDCLEEAGMCTNGPRYLITEKGRVALANARVALSSP